MFRHRAIFSTIGYYVGLAALICVLSIYGVSSWIFGTVILYLCGSLTISVGYHRLFCHGAFNTNKVWHYIFAIYGVFFLYSSPLQWAVTHATHHKHSDTEKDPHPIPLTINSFLRKGYRDVPLDVFRAKRLLRSNLHYTVDKYYMLIYIILCLSVIAISPFFFFMCYLPALGLAHLVGAFHNTFSHSGNTPRDLWLLEWILPSAGEWNHGYHHKNPRDWQFGDRLYKLDTGSWLIRLIRS